MRVFPQSLEAVLKTPFLIEPEWSRFSKLLIGYLDEISEGDTVLVASVDSLESLAAMFATIVRSGRVFLANPRWKTAEWQVVSDLVSFDKVYGPSEVSASASQSRHVGLAQIMIPSGGTSGHLRFCVHNLDTLSAAVQNLYDFHGGSSLSSISVLGVYHVSGLMPVVRACLTGGCVTLAEWESLRSGKFPRVPESHASISLVPTQLSRFIQSEAGLRFLHGLDSIYLGGAAATPQLVNLIRSEKLPVLFVYGMTETAAMVVVGSRADTDSLGAVWGRPLPGVMVTISEAEEIRVKTKSLYQGYFPDVQPVEEHFTGDLGCWTADNQLQVLGRKDFMINTGGEKVNPYEIEQYLETWLPGSNMAVSSRRSDVWGEEVVAVVEATMSVEQKNGLLSKLAHQLAAYKVPKVILDGVPIPRSSLGKVNRAVLKETIRNRIS